MYWLQCRLKELGYYTGTITGGYYSGTQKAVKAFQKANGIYATGTADVETLEAIYADVLDRAGHAARHPDAGADAGAHAHAGAQASTPEAGKNVQP